MRDFAMEHPLIVLVIVFIICATASDALTAFAKHCH